MKQRFSVLDGEIYNSNAGLIFADGESVYRATPVKDDDLTLLKEIVRRANDFEPGGELATLRAQVAELRGQLVLSNHWLAHLKKRFGSDEIANDGPIAQTILDNTAALAKGGDA